MLDVPLARKQYLLLVKLETKHDGRSSDAVMAIAHITNYDHTKLNVLFTKVTSDL